MPKKPGPSSIQPRSEHTNPWVIKADAPAAPAKATAKKPAKKPAKPAAKK